MSPKTELHGNGRSHSPLQDLIDGRFMPVLADASAVDPQTVTRVVLCSGKFFTNCTRSASARPARMWRSSVWSSSIRFRRRHLWPRWRHSLT